ncbi:MAG: trehalose-6-phosphate synthase [Acidimicrobiales bacterium]
MQHRPIVIASNRGPVSFRVDPDAPGGVVARRGAGGLVSGLGPLVRGTDALWVAAAMTEGDRLVAARGATEAEGHRVRLLDVAPATWDAFYDRVCNEALWFVHHGLNDATYEPAWPTGWLEGPWAAYREVNDAFAAALEADAPDGAVVLVQDYHLCLVASRLRASRPDLHLVHFSHTPFAPPHWLRQLPLAAARELIEGLAAHHACGFHSTRWLEDFLACCRWLDVAAPHAFASPLGIDVDDLEASLAAPAARAAMADLDELVGDRAFLVRVDRIELSKNVLRGFLAYEALLESAPQWRERVVFGAFVYPSRQGVPAYDRYARAVAEAVERIDARFATDGWRPIHYDPATTTPARWRRWRADVVLVNPVRDGLNLVAKEAAALSRREAGVVLSPEAGVG